jgi:hypothetical protein
MDKKEIIKYAFFNSFGATLYIIAIAVFMYLGGKGIFGEGNTIFSPIIMLMLFVFSAAFTGSLIFGRPILWYLDNKKREALSLILYTLGIFLLLTIIILLIFILLM